MSRSCWCVATGLVLWLTPQNAGVAAGIQPASPTDLIAEVRTLAWAEAVDDAQTLIEERRGQSDPLSPEWLVAVSWVARGASFAERWDVAEAYAREAFDGSVSSLEARPLDDERHLPTALGAAIEVLGRVYEARGERSAAVAFLQAQHARYAGTSIERRLQKNILLLSLEGQSFPELSADSPHWHGATLGRQSRGQGRGGLLLSPLVSGLQAPDARARRPA